MGIGEDDLGVVVFHHLAHVEEGGLVADAGRLLHVVGHDDYGHLLAQLAYQLLDLGRGDRVERRRGFVHKQHRGGDRHRAGYAQALLLASREGEGRVVELVLDLLPESGASEGLLHPVGDEGLVAYAVDPQAVGYIVEDAFREGIGALEDHAHLLAKFVHLHSRGVDVLAVDEYLAVQAGSRDEVVHAVEQAQKGRLPAAGRPDERHDLVAGNLHRDALERVEAAVVEVHVPGFNLFHILFHFQSVLEILAQQAGEQVYHQHDDDQHERGAVGYGLLGLDVGAAGRNHVEVVGQRHALVEYRRGQLRKEVGGTGEEDGRGLSGDPAQREYQPGDHPGHGHGQHYLPDGLELGGSQGEAAFAYSPGNILECLLGGAYDQREGEQPERQRAGEYAVAEAQVLDEEGHAEESEDDGGHSA